MSRSFRWWAVAGLTVAASGCALQDTRYDYSRSALPFADYDTSILDWNFPTTTNQGLLTPPERLRPVRPAVGVPWATTDPLARNTQAPVGDAPPAVAADAHDGDAACDASCATSASPDATPDAGAAPGLRGTLRTATR